MRGLIWFREDLRIEDNTALFHAAQQCDAGVVALYVIDTAMWSEHHVAACRVEFILRGLQKLSADLNILNIPLLIVNKHADTAQEIFNIVKNVKADAVFFNRQYEVNELKRDQAVSTFLQAHAISCFSYDDQTILPPGMVKTQQGDYFKVFTAYRRAWCRIYKQQNGVKIFPKPKKQPPIDIESSSVPTSIAQFACSIDPQHWPAGEQAAHKHLDNFVTHNIYQYNIQRDFPAIDGTSKLSPYLAAGMISPRQCFRAALEANENELETGSPGVLTWLGELIWREFYKNILIDVPRISMHRAYKLETEILRWHFNQKQLEAWQQGNTGFPIIDAAMRQLNTTGWMHNRLRMITAMFFAKNLFFDWRLGEEYFMSQLIDGDLAANNGGWQWCASTGTDAVPYFRVFNPVTQSERFDPEGEFIRQYCPELSKLDNRDIHNPHARVPLLAAQCHYPAPTVSLDVSRKHAINQFKSLTKTK